MPITPQLHRLSGLFVNTPHVGFTPNAFTFCMYFHRGRHMSFIALCFSAPYHPYYHNFVTHLCSYRLFLGQEQCIKAPSTLFSAVTYSARYRGVRNRHGHRRPQTLLEYIKHCTVKLVIPFLPCSGY